MSLPPAELVVTPTQWEACLLKLQAAPQLAIDLEANSMFAYRERVCLIQISTANEDFIIDPLMEMDLSGLGAILQDERVEKIFHAAEYDLILLKREYDWDVRNLFDTMWAGRILGYKRYGLASMLEELYDIHLNKQFQKSNWCQRPLIPAQLTYAQLDTHYLLRLRADLGEQLIRSGRAAEAAEAFVRQTEVKLSENQFDPDSFWSINGVQHLSRQQQAVVKALHIYRDQEAQKRDQPLFKVLSDRTLLELAEKLPSNLYELHAIHGMTGGQVGRYGRSILQAIAQGKRDKPPAFPKRPKRIPDEVMLRYEKLHLWRKTRAQERGVESDVILNREVLWTLAHQNPQAMEELQKLIGISDLITQMYGKEILHLLTEEETQ